MTKQARIIVTADDAGCCEEIDLAIEELARRGVITHVSAFANFGRLNAILQRLKDTVLVGLHLNTSSGRPLSPIATVKSLVGAEGLFHSPTPVHSTEIVASLNRFKRDVVPHYDLSEVITEFKAQVAIFTRVRGQTPTFITVHHDLDQVLLVSSAVYAAIPGVLSREGMLRAGIVKNVVSTFVPEFATANDASASILETIDRAIRESRTAESKLVEVVCHPAVSASIPCQFSAYRRGRFLEFQAWTSPTMQTFLASGIRLDSMLYFEPGATP